MYQPLFWTVKLEFHDLKEDDSLVGVTAKEICDDATTGIIGSHHERTMEGP